MKNTLLLLTVLLLSVSCKDLKKDSEIATQMQQVMAIHDAVMPKMGTVGQLMDELKSKTGTPGNGQSYEATIQKLQASNSAMMEWMQNFSQRFNAEEILNAQSLSVQKQSWLNEEEQRVKALQNQINASIEQAKTLLNTR